MNGLLDGEHTCPILKQEEIRLHNRSQTFRASWGLCIAFSKKMIPAHVLSTALHSVVFACYGLPILEECLVLHVIVDFVSLNKLKVLDECLVLHVIVDFVSLNKLKVLDECLVLHIIVDFVSLNKLKVPR